MSFQAGIFYFDDFEIPDSEIAAIVDRLGSSHHGEPVSHRRRDVLLVHSISPLAKPGPSPLAITFDGRLDNRADLLPRLGDLVREDTSDAALALAAYEKWGSDGLVHLIGDWSLAIWDAARKSIVLGSDFAGVRPLYYCVQRTRVLWSTLLEPLVDWTQISEFDDQYAAGFLMFGGCPNRTPYRGIWSVPPGHSVELRKDETKIRTFWEPPVASAIRYPRDSDYEEQLRALFRDAVQCRLRTEGTVLCELSGGLDSSSIVCMASNLIGGGETRTQRLATLTYEHEGSIDAPFYTAVEQHCGVQGIHVPVNAYPFITELATGGARPAFWETLHTHIAALARQIGANTYCTGQTGDLIMGNWWDDSDQVAGQLRDGRIGLALKESLAWSKILRIPIYWVLWRAFLAALPPSLAPASAYRRTGGSYSPLSREDSIAPAFRKRTGISGPKMFFSQEWIQARPERRKQFRGVMESLELRRLQPSGPLQHLSYTHPYAHRPLVEFMLSIPAAIVCRPGEPRRLMRRAFEGLWPPELRRRRSKDAFTGVFLEALRPLASDLLKQGHRLQVVDRGYVEPESLKKRLDQLTHSLDCNEPQLRFIILLELWLRGWEHRRQS